MYNYKDKAFRDFEMNVGAVDSEYGRMIKVTARSSLEAGFIILEKDLIPPGYVVHSLVDPVGRVGYKGL